MLKMLPIFAVSNFYEGSFIFFICYRLRHFLRKIVVPLQKKYHPMHNYRFFIHLSYKGTQYHGWQLQRNAHTVQAALNSALQQVLGEPVETLGCGRTDAGVHARRFTAHFDTSTPLADAQRLVRRLNSILPPDIACRLIHAVPPGANARFDATSRTYKYFVTLAKSPFSAEYAHCLHYALDVEAMNRAAALLLPATDFTSFAKLHSQTKTNTCSVLCAYWSESKVNSTLTFTITANRFLRNMVRSIVGTLIDVGRGRLTVDDFSRIIDSKERCRSSSSAPAQGLFLWEVEYPQGLVPPEAYFAKIEAASQ
jgi:tRNA pseudouridine38-40 synthase